MNGSGVDLECQVEQQMYSNGTLLLLLAVPLATAAAADTVAWSVHTLSHINEESW